MRVWDLSPKYLCRPHLLGEHAEIHAIWSVITEKKEGYHNHPEVKRWRGKLKALYLRHNQVVAEMEKRGYLHKSRLSSQKAKGEDKQNNQVDSLKRQVAILKGKGCRCHL